MELFIYLMPLTAMTVVSSVQKGKCFSWSRISIIGFSLPILIHANKTIETQSLLHYRAPFLDRLSLEMVRPYQVGGQDEKVKGRCLFYHYFQTLFKVIQFHRMDLRT